MDNDERRVQSPEGSEARVSEENMSSEDSAWSQEDSGEDRERGTLQLDGGKQRGV